MESPTTTVVRLRSAREKLDAKDLPGAMAIYEEVLSAAGDRADVLVTISGDLGSTGHVVQVIELVAPRYDANRHGPATGMNLLQAYLAARDPESAQHILDILFSLNRTDLEERLYGFSNAVAELMLSLTSGDQVSLNAAPADFVPPPNSPKVAIVTISKPIWFYGLEALAGQILPPEGGKPRRVAFAQLALPNAYRNIEAAMKEPEDELGRLSRAIPVWLAESFYFSQTYAPVAAVAMVDEPDGARHSMLFNGEWTTDALRQLVDSTAGGLDYVFTGALKQQAGDFELSFRVWEVKKFRERKQFVIRWNPSTADQELTKLRDALRMYMEWRPTPAGVGLAYDPPAPRAWIDVLGASLNLFLVDKKVMPAALLPNMEGLAAESARLAEGSATASLAWITLDLRTKTLGLPRPPRPARLADQGIVREAEKIAG